MADNTKTSDTLEAINVAQTNNAEQVVVQMDVEKDTLDKKKVDVALKPLKETATTTTASATITTTPQDVATPTTSQVNRYVTNFEKESERTCWICFATDEDIRLAAWVQPCKCRGTTKWVHQSCLYRWVDEKQKGNALRPVTCQQCQTEYIIVFPYMGKLANLLETFDNLVKRLSPFLAAGIFVGSLYWTAVTYGAVTFLQIVGYKQGIIFLENGDPLILLIGLPAIPVGLVLGRMIRWEEAVLRIIRNRRNITRKLPLMNLIIPYPPEEDDEQQIQQNPATPTLSDPVSATRIFCGALILPTISSTVGRLLFETIENTLHRTLIGGLTYIVTKGILNIYLKQKQYNRKKKRRIVDYTEENIRLYVTSARSNNHNNNRNNPTAGHPGGNAAAYAPNSHQQQQQQQQRANNSIV